MNEKELIDLINDPADYFNSPEDILKDDRLSEIEKHKILLSWARECREHQVATEENMGNAGDDDNDLLDRIETAITKGLGLPLHLDKAAPTKHGG